MGVGIQVGNLIDEIGTGDFLMAFFSTVSGNLEPRWGARFPLLMGPFYQGGLTAGQAAMALTELADIRSALAQLGPERVIWNIEDRTQQPPWGTRISADITDLSNYFVTSTGRDLIGVLQEALEAARDEAMPATIVSY